MGESDRQQGGSDYQAGRLKWLIGLDIGLGTPYIVITQVNVHLERRKDR